jgi:hypothetical protein
MSLKRSCVRLAAAALLLAAGAGPRLLTAQTQLSDDGCKFKTRWKDGHGRCPACCNSIEYSCPCTI